jgi:tetratricopeptide (TPR) repeat protein
MPVRRLTPNNNKRQVDDVPVGLARRLGSRSIAIVIYLFLVGISLAVFGQTIGYDFVNFDDDVYVYKAPAIQAGLTVKGLALAFTSPHARNWHPLTTISHMLDCQLYGLKAGGHHATNVLLHIIAVLLLFRVLWQMTGALWKSATVAALFAVHPLHVESVAWVSERKDVLSAVFFLLMLEAYFRYTRARSVRWYLAVVVLFVAGLMSKPMLVSAPVILLLLDYWPLRRFEQLSSTKDKAKIARSEDRWRARRDLFLEKVPLLAIAAGSCVITFILQKRATGAIPPLPLLWRIENAVVTYVIYFWKTLWPTRLAVFYPHPNDTLTIWEILLAIGLLLAMTIAAIVFRRKRPYFFTGWFWYVGMLVPVVGIVQVGEQGHADRYTYLPHIGLFLLAVWLVADVTAVSQRSSRVAVASAVIIVVLGLAWASFIQTSYWRNSETLWTHALAVTSNNDVAHNNLGYLCAARGELDKAISHFETASRIRSRKRDPHYSVGSAFVQVNLADALGRKGQPDEAIVHYDEAIKLLPNYADAYYDRGNILFAEGRIDEAMADWEKTLQIRPDDADAHTCLGNALLRRGSVREAVAHYENAIALAPEDPHSRINVAWVLATAADASIRDGIKAVEFAQQAIELSGGKDPNFLRTLAAAYAESGRFSEAITTAKQAILIATMQGNSRFAKVLEEDVGLYRDRVPLRASKSPD